MITVVVGKRRNTTPWFSAVGEKTEQTATANCTNRDRKPHDRDRKLHEPRPLTARTATARTATANRTKRDRKPHEPRPHGTLPEIWDILLPLL